MADFLDIFLEDNKDYRAFINAVFKHAITIEYVVLDYLDGHPDILSYLDDNNIAPKKVKNWQGTHTRSKNNDIYRFPATTGFKKILLGFDNFYIIERKESGLKNPPLGVGSNKLIPELVNYSPGIRSNFMGSP